MGRGVSRTRSRRGLLVVAAFLVAVLSLVDLMRRDSLLRGAWRSTVTDEGAPIERILRGTGILRRR